MSKVNAGKWMYNLNGREIWSGEKFDTKEEAIQKGRKAASELQEEAFCNDNFEVGQIAEVSVSGVDVDFILENVAENTTIDCGEVGEDYLCDVSSEDARELEEKLNEVLFAWMKEHDYEPDFYTIENVEEIKLEQLN